MGLSYKRPEMKGIKCYCDEISTVSIFQLKNQKFPFVRLFETSALPFLPKCTDIGF